MPDLFEYQKTGRAFLLANNRCMLGDQPGLGKTAQALTALNALGMDTVLKVCIIAPRTALKNWGREMVKWDAKDKSRRVMITNYEQLVYETADAERFKRTKWDVVIIDEAHRLKNAGAKRTQNIYRTIRDVKRIWLLTGTPARNHAGELWTHIVSLRPDIIQSQSGTMSQEQFESEYCKVTTDKFGYPKIVGSKNMKDLRSKLETSGFFLRRLKKDVLKDLPDLIMDDYPLPVPKDIYDEITRASLDEVYDGMLKLSDDEIMDFVKDPPDGLPLSSVMHILGVAKAAPVSDMVDNELNAPGKIIVFYKHAKVGDILEQRLGKHAPVRVDGSTKDPQAAVDTFQTDPECRVFLGQIQACQEAINLTAATQCVFAEASWSPADNEQAACRGHRIGMQPGYVVRFANFPGTLDEVVSRVLRRKTEELYQLFG